MRLYLVRHAQTAWNAAGRAQGHSDIGLDDEGKRQSKMLARELRDRDIVRVLSSDLSRSAETARTIAEEANVPLELRECLRERMLGDWEGVLFSDILMLREGLQTKTNGDEAHTFDFRPPNGETLQDVWDRLSPIADELFGLENPVVIVTHGGACALLLAKLLHGSLRTARSFVFDNASITELHFRPEGNFRLIRLNETSHLLRDRDVETADAARA